MEIIAIINWGERLVKQMKIKYNAAIFCEPIADIKNSLSEMKVKPKIILMGLRQFSEKHIMG